ncbi:DUF1871 family protein, partial [Bacillus altitudinis]|uniref:DUF1871 family protein n=1 Tax=Bacillus altitudinis TaxID=293387 RepID=UPI00307EA167
MIQLINPSHPFQYAQHFYQTHPPHLITPLYHPQHPLSFPKHIQPIYHHSFHQLLPIQSCHHIPN